MKPTTRKLLIGYLQDEGVKPEVAEKILDLTFTAIKKCLLKNRIIDIESICTLMLIERKQTRRKVPNVGMVEMPKQLTIHLKTDKNFNQKLKSITNPQATA